MVQLFISIALYSWVTKKISYDAAIEKLEQVYQLIGPYAQTFFQNPQEIEKKELLKHGTIIRVTLIKPDGQVLFDTNADEYELASHLTKDRVEISSAMSGIKGQSTRVSESTHIEYLYVATPIMAEENLIGVLRLATPIHGLELKWKELLYLGISWAAVLFIMVILLALFLAKRFVRPVEEIQAVSEKISSGQWDYQFPDGADYSYELYNLRNSLDKMRTYVQGRLKKILKQKHELRSILSSVDEGLLTLDNNLEIFHYNSAFIKLFEISEKFVSKGEPLEKLLLPIEIGEAAKKILKGGAGLEMELTYNKKHINLRLKPLMDGQGALMGVLLVFSDRTKLVKLENMRKEFVSNVGHELKTPLTAIQGYLETMLDGKVDDPELQKKFLKTTHEQTIRLNSLISDILKLSTIEKENDFLEVRLVAVELGTRIEKAIEICQRKARDNKITIVNKVPANLKVKGDERLLEQVLINLLDNAIKFSHSGGVVEIDGELKENGKYQFNVRDFGIGIPQEFHERIFERFYSVDKSRSRELGGTGLGLSIVKHILLTLRAQIFVSSEGQNGTTFSVLIDLAS